MKRIVSLLLAVLLVRKQKNGLRFAGAGYLAGAAALFAAVGIVVLLASRDFTAVFVKFHEIFFTNDLWLLNPQTDILIRMMPQLLFERAAKDVAAKALQTFMIMWVMQCAIYFLVGGMIRRSLTERDKP